MPTSQPIRYQTVSPKSSAPSPRCTCAEIPIVEHLPGLEALPITGFRSSAVPVKVKGTGTFPVRAYAVLQESAE